MPSAPHPPSPRSARVTAGVVVLCALSTSSLPTPALAQDAAAKPPPTVELTPRQLDLINEGARASNAGDYQAAISALRSALDLGEVNVTLLNLGRALQKSERCREARAMYDRALAAPRVKTPDPGTIQTAIDKFVAELRRDCTGDVELVCPSQATTVTLIDPGGTTIGPLTCAQKLPPLKPGTYTLQAKLGDAHQSSQLEVVGAETLRVELSLKATAPALSTHKDSTLNPEPSSTYISVGARYLTQVGYASGPLTTDDGTTPLDALPADGQQDELNGLQVSRFAHVLELDAGYGEGAWWAGAIGHLQLATLAVDGGVAGRWIPWRAGAWETDLRLQLTYGALEQVMSDDEERFVARSGPVAVGIGGGVTWWMTPEWGFGIGVDGRAGLPDLGMVTNWRGGVEWRL